MAGDGVVETLGGGVVDVDGEDGAISPTWGMAIFSWIWEGAGILEGGFVEDDGEEGATSPPEYEEQEQVFEYEEQVEGVEYEEQVEGVEYEEQVVELEYAEQV